MKVKICGIRSLEDALCAAKYKAWAIGFNFYKSSPRYISLKSAMEISKYLPKSLKKVGIFIEPTTDIIIKSLAFLDYVQIYENIPSIDKRRVIFALQANSFEALPSDTLLSSYAYLLLDAPKETDGLHGGTGRLANWFLAKQLASTNRLILAGGLNASNVENAIQSVRPFAVDVASGSESSPGKKNLDLMKNFILRCKYVD